MLRTLIIELAAVFFFTACINSKNFHRLIRSPDKYQNQTVTIKGFLHLTPTESLIYLDKREFENGLKRNRFLLTFNDTLAFDTTDANNKYVEIDGVFNYSKELVKTGLYNGEVLNITRVEKRTKK